MSCSMEIVGKVSYISGEGRDDDGRPYGEVGIWVKRLAERGVDSSGRNATTKRVYADNAGVRYYARLNVEQYDKAIEAHMRNKFVRLVAERKNFSARNFDGDARIEIVEFDLYEE